MQVKLLRFQITGEVHGDETGSIASVQIGDKGYYVQGIYNVSTNEFSPMILGDPYEIEDHYDEIKRLVKER